MYKARCNCKKHTLAPTFRQRKNEHHVKAKNENEVWIAKSKNFNGFMV